MQVCRSESVLVGGGRSCFVGGPHSGLGLQRWSRVHPARQLKVSRGGVDAKAIRYQLGEIPDHEPKDTHQESLE